MWNSLFHVVQFSEWWIVFYREYDALCAQCIVYYVCCNVFNGIYIFISIIETVFSNLCFWKRWIESMKDGFFIPISSLVIQLSISLVNTQMRIIKDNKKCSVLITIHNREGEKQNNCDSHWWNLRLMMFDHAKQKEDCFLISVSKNVVNSQILRTQFTINLFPLFVFFELIFLFTVTLFWWMFKDA
jgi:hypothetical protein